MHCMNMHSIDRPFDERFLWTLCTGLPVGSAKLLMYVRVLLHCCFWGLPGLGLMCVHPGVPSNAKMCLSCM